MDLLSIYWPVFCRATHSEEAKLNTVTLCTAFKMFDTLSCKISQLNGRIERKVNEESRNLVGQSYSDERNQNFYDGREGGENKFRFFFRKMDSEVPSSPNINVLREKIALAISYQNEVKEVDENEELLDLTLKFLTVHFEVSTHLNQYIGIDIKLLSSFTHNLLKEYHRISEQVECSQKRVNLLDRLFKAFLSLIDKSDEIAISMVIRIFFSSDDSSRAPGAKNFTSLFSTWVRNDFSGDQETQLTILHYLQYHSTNQRIQVPRELLIYLSELLESIQSFQADVLSQSIQIKLFSLVVESLFSRNENLTQQKKDNEKQRECRPILPNYIEPESYYPRWMTEDDIKLYDLARQVLDLSDEQNSILKDIISY